MYKRKAFHTLLKRIEEPRRFIQVLAWAPTNRKDNPGPADR